MAHTQSIFANVTCPRCRTMLRQLEIEGQPTEDARRLDGHAQCPMCKHELTIDLFIGDESIVSVEVNAQRTPALMAS